MSGSFFLGTGHVSGSSEMEYFFFKENKVGKKLKSVKAKNTYIRETDNQKPCLIYRYDEYKMTGIFNWLFGDWTYRLKKDNVVVVPKDTVKIEYNVDI